MANKLRTNPEARFLSPGRTGPAGPRHKRCEALPDIEWALLLSDKPVGGAIVARTACALPNGLRWRRVGASEREKTQRLLRSSMWRLPMGTATKNGKTALLRVRDRIEMPGLTLLPARASENERVGYIRTHTRAMQACGRRTLQHAWLVGHEVAKLKQIRKDLMGARWDRYLRDAFDFGDRQASTLMRLARSFPTCRSLPPDIRSIRGAIESLRLKRECDTAEAQARSGPKYGSALSTEKRTRNGETGASDAWDNSSDESWAGMSHVAPSTPIPSSVRAELQAITRDLWEIARTDRAALRKVRDFVRKQRRIASGKGKRASARRAG